MRFITYNPYNAVVNTNRKSNFDGHQAPSVNVLEKNNGYYLDLISPGFQKEDFKIELKNNQLTVSAEKKTESESNEKDKVLRHEYSYSSFSRSFYLPETVVSDAIEATYEQGVLKLYIPKKAEAIPSVKNIEIA